MFLFISHSGTKKILETINFKNPPSQDSKINFAPTVAVVVVVVLVVVVVVVSNRSHLENLEISIYFNGRNKYFQKPQKLLLTKKTFQLSLPPTLSCEENSLNNNAAS